MPKPTDVRAVASTLYFLPVTTRVPLKFGPEVTTQVTCARVRLAVADSPRADRPKGGARLRSASSGSGRARSPTRSGTRP